MALSWAGTSFTVANLGYSYQTDNWVKSNYPIYDLSSNHAGAVNGNNSWSMLVRLSSDVLNSAPDKVIFDCVNDGGNNHCRKAVEALIRRIWAHNPAIKIIIVRAFSIHTTHNIDTADQITSGQINELDTLVAAYQIDVVDYYSAVKTLVDGGASITDYVSGDWVHPSTNGYNLLAGLVEQIILTGGTPQIGTLPDLVYDTNSDFQKVPTKKLGTAYDSRVGTWADSGSEVSSSTVGDTITFTVDNASAHSIGCYRADGLTNDVTISFDGGAFSAVVFYQNGVEVPAGFTTAIIKVNSGTVKIGEFWAI